MSQPRERDVDLTICYIALGANVTSLQGGPLLTIKHSIERLDADSLTSLRVSSLYDTPAFPPGSGPSYVNAVAQLETNLTEGQVLEWLHEIEAEFGRLRENRWSARTLDLDLLSYGNAILPDVTTYEKWRDLPLKAQMGKTPDQLILPHPRLQDRAFVLIPWAEIAPDWVHPVSGLTVEQMCARLPEADKHAVKRLSS